MSNVALTRLRLRLSNSHANREVLWRPMDAKSKSNAAVWFLVAVVVNVGVVALLIAWFG